ncbi:amidohydrolase family protein [bacterium]|nr:amidohydrolase family protein [bacterium]
MTLNKAKNMYSADRILVGNHMLSGSVLIARESGIESIVDRNAVSPASKTVDFPGLIIAPLFCDYHLHFFSQRQEQVLATAEQLLSHGITAAHDGGDPVMCGLQAREELCKQLRIVTCGYALYKAGGYGSYIGRAVIDLQEARQRIDELCENQADYLKVIGSGIFNPADGQISQGGFKPDELAEIVNYAAGCGLRTACHVNGGEKIQEAVSAGVDEIIHGLGVTADTLKEMCERGTALIPTINAFQGLARMTAKKEALQNIELALDLHLAAVAAAHSLGVRVLPGSDAGASYLPYGESYIQELRALHSAGIPIEEVLALASAAPFQKGMPAEFVVLNGLNIKHVIRQGQDLIV